MKRRVLGVLLAAAVMVGTFAGCGSTSEDSTQSDPATENVAATESVSTEKMVISISSWDLQEQFNEENAANDTIYNEMSDKLGIEVDPISVTWNDWTEKNNVWAASGQLPDMFTAAVATDNPGLYRTWARQGIIKALPDDLSAYPNLERIMQMYSVQPLKVDGKFYCIPRMTYADSDSWVLDRLILYRKDWAAEAGWTEEPQTFDEFVQMCEDVKAIKQDATILTVNNNSYLMYLGSDILPQFSNNLSWVYEGEQWVPSYTSEKVPEILERFQDLYRRGILDPDFATMKDGDAANKFYSGQAFSFVMGAPTTAQAQQLMDADPSVTSLNESLGMISSFTSEDGNNYYFSTYPYWSETLISASVDDEKLVKCLELMDYMLSDEFKSLKNKGIEGVDWEMQDGTPVLLLEDMNALTEKYPISSGGKFGCFASWDNDYAYSNDMIVDPNPEYASLNAAKAELYQTVKENDIAAPINFDVMLMDNEEMTQYGSNIRTCFEEYLVNITIGEESAADGYQKMINEMNNLGLQEMITSVTEQAKAEGIEP